MEEKFYFSKKKLEELKSELDFLKTEKRAETIRAIDHAKSFGDLSENAEYHSAREEQAWNEDKIKKMEHMLRNAILVEDSHLTSKVSIGATVSLECRGKEIHYTIVSPEEMDPSTGKISYKSPIGAELLDKKVGDIVAIKTPVGENKYKVISIK